MSQTVDLARQLTDLVQAVPGVSTIYRSTSMFVNAIATVAEFVAPDHALPALVLVDEKSDTTIVTAMIGVADGEAAPEMSRKVHDAISAYLDENGVQARVIRVTVGSVG